MTSCDNEIKENANNINIWNNLKEHFTIEISGKAVGRIGIVLNSEVERISTETGCWLGEKY